jgi:hypothetical protein
MLVSSIECVAVAAAETVLLLSLLPVDPPATRVRARTGVRLRVAAAKLRP